MDKIVDNFVKYAFQLFVVLAAIIFLNQLLNINETNVKIATELTSIKVEITRGLGVEYVSDGRYSGHYEGKLGSIDRRLGSIDRCLESIDRRFESIDRTLKFK